MSFNKNNKNAKINNPEDIKNGLELDIDGRSIKSHLDTSFDLNGIHVSEDLINRTLNAIKQQEVEQQETAQQDSKEGNEKEIVKIIPWSRYIRRIVGVAAAVLVVTAGVNFISGMNSKKDSSENTALSLSEDISQKDVVTSGTESAESYKMDNGTTAGIESEVPQAKAEISQASEYALSQDTSGTDGVEEKKQTEETETSKVTAADSSVDDIAAAEGIAQTPNVAVTDAAGKNSASRGMLAGIDNDAGSTEASDTTEDADSVNASAAIDNDNTVQGITATLDGEDDVSYITFRDILLSDPEQVQILSITDEINKTEITLTDQEDIKDFYLIMDQQQYTNTTITSVIKNYTVEVATAQSLDVSYTIVIGDSITVSNHSGETVNQNIYSAENETLLIGNLNEFYQKYIP
ncbi:MAG: hypothetical protein PHF63_01080 [Herbinix sp.]|nr:hypothetical protein [Herbinix sp.]